MQIERKLKNRQINSIENKMVQNRKENMSIENNRIEKKILEMTEHNV